MIRFLIVLSASAAVLLARPLPADACGLKVASSGLRTRTPTEESDRPSRVLLLGDHSRRTATALVEAGHSVDVADDVDTARGRSYHVIVADEDHAAQARELWPGAIVVAGASNSQDVTTRLEGELRAHPDRRLVARKLIGTSRQPRAGAASPEAEGRKRVASGGDARERVPVATGGGTSRSVPGDAPSGAGANADAPADDGAGASSSDSTLATTIEAPTEEPAAVDEPERPAPRVRRRRGFTTHIYFKNASTELSRRFQMKLARNARWLARHPKVTVQIHGHTNSLGPVQLNKALSEQRAEAVRDFLAAKGVDESRMQTEGFGMSRLQLKPGIHPKNRRVVIIIEP
jgi:peptidoglycan-associated lipoprotein